MTSHLASTCRDAIRQALRELRRADLLVMLLAIDAGLRDAEIAEALGWDTDRVRRRRRTLWNRIRVAMRAAAMAATP